MSVTFDVPMISPCCPCHGIETGAWGLIYYDPSGKCMCLQFPGTGVKTLKGDENGPYWANS